MARHYEETGDPLDLAAIDGILPANHGQLDETWIGYHERATMTRETSYRLLGGLDRIRLGMTPNQYTDVNAKLLLGHIAQWVVPAAQRYGKVIRPFMAGLNMKSLIAYWDWYRTETDPARAAIVAAIPPAVESLCDFIWDVGWWPSGSIKYIAPAGTDPSLADITGLTVEAVEGEFVFTGPASLSAVDDYYKYLSVVPAVSQGDVEPYVIGYDGAARRFTVRVMGGNFTFTPGMEFLLRPVGQDVAGGGVASDEPSPVLNPLVAPAYAWTYWYRKVVLGDAAGAARHRLRHDAMFDGQTMAWTSVFSQKEWNQAMLWSTDGLAWRKHGDLGTDYGSQAATSILILTHPLGGLLLFQGGA